MSKSRYLLCALSLLILISLAGCVGIGGMTFSPQSSITQDTRSKAEIVKSYGTPSKIEKISEYEENLVFDSGLRWSGCIVIIGVVIPIPMPLMVPSGRNRTTFHIKNDQAVEMSSSFNKDSLCFAGYAMMNEGIGAGRFTFECSK